MNESQTETGLRHQSLKMLPVGLFAAVMGVTGLGLVWWQFAEVFALDALYGDILVFVGALIFAVLAGAYGLKSIRHADAVAGEYADTAGAGFFSAIPIGVLLIAAGWAIRWPALANLLFWISTTAMLALAALLMARLVRDTHALDAANGSWLLGMVSPILAPLAGGPLGHTEMSYLCLSVGLGMWLVLFPIILARTIFGSPVPPSARPTWFILLVPPMIIFVGYLQLTGNGLDMFARTLFFLGLLLFAALCWASRDVVRWPFSVAWWAFTFPLDAVAAGAVVYHQAAPTEATQSVAIAAVALATVTITAVSARTLHALFSGTLLINPPVPAKP